MANLLETLDEQFSENLQEHGHYLTDPYAHEDETLRKAVDAVAAFVPEDRREHVRQELLNVIKTNQSPR
jgi:hypothetical protein